MYVCILVSSRVVRFVKICMMIIVIIVASIRFLYYFVDLNSYADIRLLLFVSIPSGFSKNPRILRLILRVKFTFLVPLLPLLPARYAVSQCFS